MRFISYYTTGGKYETAAQKLAESARRVGLDHGVRLYALPELPEWKDNIFRKARVIRGAMDEFPGEDIVWIDADAWFASHPTLFFKISQDSPAFFAAYIELPQNLYGGVKWFRASADSRLIVDRWIEQNEKTPQYVDDNNLLFVLKGYKPGKIYYLPPAYCWTEAWFRRRFPGAKPVIYHDMIVTAGNWAQRSDVTTRGGNP